MQLSPGARYCVLGSSDFNVLFYKMFLLPSQAAELFTKTTLTCIQHNSKARQLAFAGPDYKDLIMSRFLVILQHGCMAVWQFCWMAEWFAFRLSKSKLFCAHNFCWEILRK